MPEKVKFQLSPELERGQSVRAESNVERGITPAPSSTQVIVQSDPQKMTQNLQGLVKHFTKLLDH